MPIHANIRERLAVVGYLLKWTALAVPLGLMVGSACAYFLWALEQAVNLQQTQPWLLFALPVAGLAIGWMYWAFGQSVEAGNNLIMDEIHAPGGGVPVRMAPLVLVGTVVTHLFGGSAGREGTAVQMGGSLAAELGRWIPGLGRRDVQTLLMAGVAAGFGGVFGTPVAGMIFALEVLVVGRMNYHAIFPCLIAAIASDQTCLAWGIGHTQYYIASAMPHGSLSHVAPFDAALMAGAAGAGILFGLASLLFAELTHGVHWLFKRYVSWPIVRPMLGGFGVIGLVWLVGSRDYLGLGVSSPDNSVVTIVSSFREGGAHPWSWWWKILFTAITLGSGFKGGEVTPLFFVGAALGNTLAMLTGAPVDVFAALGFVAVFAGATNTPLACTMMSVELFGGEYVVYFAVCCLFAYLCSGNSGIYLSQRIGTPKLGSSKLPPETSLRSAREARPGLHRLLAKAVRSHRKSPDPSTETDDN